MSPMTDPVVVDRNLASPSTIVNLDCQGFLNLLIIEDTSETFNRITSLQNRNFRVYNEWHPSHINLALTIHGSRIRVVHTSLTVCVLLILE